MNVILVVSTARPDEKPRPPVAYGPFDDQGAAWSWARDYFRKGESFFILAVRPPPSA